MDMMTLWASSVRRVAEVGYFYAFTVFCLPAAISIVVFFPVDSPRFVLTGTACMQCILAAMLPFSRDAVFCAILLVNSTLNVADVFFAATLLDMRVRENIAISAASAVICVGIWAIFLFSCGAAWWRKPGPGGELLHHFANEIK